MIIVYLYKSVGITCPLLSRHDFVFGVGSLWLLEPLVNGPLVRGVFAEDLVMPMEEKNIVARW